MVIHRDVHQWKACAMEVCSKEARSFSNLTGTDGSACLAAGARMAASFW